MNELIMIVDFKRYLLTSPFRKEENTSNLMTMLDESIERGQFDNLFNDEKRYILMNPNLSDHDIAKLCSTDVAIVKKVREVIKKLGVKSEK